MKVLLATTCLALSPTTGAEIATRNFIDALCSAGCEIDVVGYLRPGSDISLPKNYHCVGIRPIESASAGLSPLGWMAKAIFEGRPYICEKFRSTSYADTIQRLVEKTSYDILVVDHSQLGWLLSLPRLPEQKIIIAHNAEGRLYRSQANQERSFLRRFFLLRDSHLISDLEAKIANTCVQLWTLTQEDREYFRDLVPDCAAKIKVLPLPGSRASRAKMSMHADRPVYDVGLIGSWGWEVNRTGLLWFLARVVPLLPTEIVIGIAGRGLEGLACSHPGVRFLGIVKDASRFRMECRVNVVPTLIGSGIQLKTIEAISAGIPVVTTSVGLRGIDEYPSFVSIADSDLDMAREITAKLGSPTDYSDEGETWCKSREDRFLSLVQAALSDVVGTNEIK